MRRDARLGDPEVAKAWALQITFTPATISEVADEARRGDVGAHWILLQQYANRIYEPELIPRELAGYIAGVLRGLIDMRSRHGMAVLTGKLPPKQERAARDGAIARMVDVARRHGWPMTKVTPTRKRPNSAFRVVKVELEKRGYPMSIESVEKIYGRVKEGRKSK